MDIILYSNNCPKCMILEEKLKTKNVNYQVISDIDVMLKKNFLFMPILEINGKTYNFEEAIDWVNSVERITNDN